MNLIPTVNTVPPWMQPKDCTPGGTLSPSLLRGPVAILMGANPDLSPEQAQALLKMKRAS
jgi:hypothetical protein